MKKMFLLAAMAATGLISANNSVVKETETVTKKTLFKECSVKVRFYNENGQYVGSQTFTSDQPTLSDCQSYQKAVKQFVQDLGYTITD